MVSDASRFKAAGQYDLIISPSGCLIFVFKIYHISGFGHGVLLIWRANLLRFLDSLTFGHITGPAEMSNLIFGNGLCI